MNQGDMNHGDMNNGDMDMPSCAMNMFLNTDTKNLCILVKQWRVTSTWSLLQSLFIIVLFAVSFEAIRELTRRYESSQKGSITLGNSRPGSPCPASNNHGTTFSRKSEMRKRQLIKSLLYSLQVGISFLLMLVFMTYNVYVMAAVVVGSGIGYYLFNSDPNGVSGKGMACH